jgi:UDP-N-acetylglucosamine--N-acetylmuramyl-(pentapeptide) pyrophosphoryl-undecaprenol N-acetylglucosamine transferase
MNSTPPQQPFVAIACGGTGGHLFPGLAVAGQLRQRGCSVALLISPKEVDQQAVQSARGLEVITLPAVALQNGNYFSFARSFWQSWRAARRYFAVHPPQAVLAMGGFTSAPPVLAAKKIRAATFLHESNTIPGRANRFLARLVDEAFVGFPGAAGRLHTARVTVSGTPVRPSFQPRDPAVCRAQLGLDPHRPTILIMGGSQGASGINGLILSVLPRLAGRDWQWLHLTGAADFDKVRAAYAGRGLKAVVKPFMTEMDLALGAATAAVSRAGASSLAEIAALRLPTLLVPYPAAADDHQLHNALAFANAGAARLLEQKTGTPEKCFASLLDLVENEQSRAGIRTALDRWHAPRAAEEIADNILQFIARRSEKPRTDGAHVAGDCCKAGA